MKREELEDDLRWGRLTKNDAREIIGRSEDPQIESTYSQSRAFITRDAVRELARQLDPPNDCPYCNGGDAQHNAALIEEDNVLLYSDHNRLVFEGYDPHGNYEDTSVEITYCPKCGRKLEAKP